MIAEMRWSNIASNGLTRPWRKLPYWKAKAINEKRQSGDYDDFIYCDKEMTDDLTVQAKTYIDSLSQLIRGE